MAKVADDLLKLWFSDRVRPLWFNATPEFDQKLKNEYSDIYFAAKNGELDYWQNTTKGSLALIILLDQIPLNIFRHSGCRYLTEKKARAVANKMIEDAEDIYLEYEQKAFVYMPFMHSENIADQDRAVDLCTREGMLENLKFAQHHRDIIRQFGRFPHRNKELNRENTEQERIYLASDDAFRA